MTIKQNGGVFGRNPTFNDVTIEGQLTFDGDIDVSSDLTVDGTLKADAVRVGDIAPSYSVLSSARNAGGSFEWGHSNSSGYPSTMGAESGSGSPYIAFNAGPGTNSNTYKTLGLLGTVVKTDASGNLRIGRLTTASADNQTPVESAVFTNSGNLYFPAGQGIDFSATAGTGTSELFDDYEEGTWTPSYIASTTNPTFSNYAFATGYYTKVGQLVYVSARMRTNGYNSDGSGDLRIGGLPYSSATIGTIGSGGSINIAGSYLFATAPVAGYFVDGSNYIQLNSNLSFTASTVSALNTGSTTNDISFFGIYRTS